MIARFLPLPIDFWSVHVKAADEGDQIRQHNPSAELIDDRHGRVRAGADAHTVRILAAIGDDIKAHITAGRLDANIALAGERLELARHFSDGWTLRQHPQALAQDFAAFLHLSDSHPITIETVAQLADCTGANGNIELEFRINGIRNIASDIPLDAGASQVWTDEIVRKRIFFTDHRNTSQPLGKNFVGGKQPIKFVHYGFEMIQKFGDPHTGLRQNIVAYPSDPDIVIGETGAADFFHQVIDGFALSQSVNKRRHCADVLTESADGNQMASDPVKFTGDHAAKLAASGDFDFAEFFRRHAENLVGEHGGKIIGAIRVRDVAMPSDLLANFLNLTMQITNVGDGLTDDFAVGLNHKTQHAVRAGMLRPNADRHIFGIKTGFSLSCLVHNLPQQLFHQRGTLGADAVVLFQFHVVLAQRVSDPIFRQHDSSQVAMSFENHAEKIINFPFKPVGHLPDSFGCGDFWIVPRQIHLQDGLMFLCI